MKLHHLFAAVLLTAASAFAGPQQQWTIVQGSPTTDDQASFLCKRVLQEGNGDAYLVGSSGGAVGTGLGSSPFVEKISAATGGVIWSASIPNPNPASYGSFYNITTDGVGNYYAIGEIGGGVGGFNECLLVKLTSVGGFSPTWLNNGHGAGVRQFGNGLTNFAGQTLVRDGSGGLFIGGAADTHIFLMRIDANGDPSGFPDLGYGVGRRYLFPTPPATASFITRGLVALDGVGGVYIAGHLPRPTTGLDLVRARYDFAGTQTSISYYSVNGSANTLDFVEDFYVDFFGDSYVTGRSDAANGTPNMVVVKWNINGVQQYVRRTATSGEGASVVADANGLVYACGTAAGRGIIWKLNSAGQFSGTWANNGPGAGRRYFGPGDATPRTLIIRAPNELYVAGGDHNFLAQPTGPALARYNLSNGTKIFHDVDSNYPLGEILGIGAMGNPTSLVIGFGHTALFGGQRDVWGSRYFP